MSILSPAFRACLNAAIAERARFGVVRMRR
jgi:hypothetical protein